MAERDYTILTQREDRGIGPDGRVIDVVHVSWQGPSGIAGSVVIPADQYSPATVDQRIRERLNVHLAVAQLGETV
jgi:hypothetical protein